MSNGLGVHRLRTFGDPVLKQESHEVTEFGHELKSLIEVMYEFMVRENGVGFAAPQIGVLQKVVVWFHPETEKRYVLVNPRVVEASEEVVTAPEGCLSVPGHTMEVTRSVRVVVEGRDVEGNEISLEAADLLARVVQHEIDHIEGRLILDRTSAEERRRVLREMRERALLL